MWSWGVGCRGCGAGGWGVGDVELGVGWRGWGGGGGVKGWRGWGVEVGRRWGMLLVAVPIPSLYGNILPPPPTLPSTPLEITGGI